MIGIICAMQIEADGIIALSENAKTESIASMNFTACTLHGRNIVIVVCGPGKVNAAMCAVMLIERYRPDVIINSGVAGSLSPLVSIGDIVVATKSVEHDMNTAALGGRQGEISFADADGGKVIYFNCDSRVCDVLFEACSGLPCLRVEQGVVASGDIFVSDRVQRMKINAEFGALACEMEGAAIGHVCYCTNTPYGIIRAISDDLDENKGMDFVKFSRLAAKNTVAAVAGFVKKY